ncbi:MAG: PAC2 family protein [Chloroflexota bacterium]
MESTEIHQAARMPSLRDPVLLAAFAGWNDAGQAATHALQTLNDAWSARRFAEIEPENFFDFSQTRPTISLGANGKRDLIWPANLFFAHRMPKQERDVVLLIGNEPQVRWKTFCGLILTIARRVNVSCLVTLGGLLADVPHTVDPVLTGLASTPRLLPQLHKMGVSTSDYEGPTGIIGALHDAWTSTGLPAISLWANVPHYISASPNPQVALALLRRVALLLGAPLPLTALELKSKEFAVQVREALAENPEALEYVRQLEEQLVESTIPEEGGTELIEALEEFLRTTRPADE